MFPSLTDRTKAILYYAIAVGLCLGVTAVTKRLGDRTPIVAMFVPLAAVLLMLLLFTRDGYSKSGWQALGLHLAGLSGWPLALLLPLLVLGFAYGTVWLSGVATLTVPPNARSFAAFLLNVILSIVVVALSGGMAEEIGWRGYLLPRLSSLGQRPALLLSGLLHGLWHLPILIWTPFYHSGGNRWMIIALFLLTLTMAGVCYGYFRLTTASVWPAAIAHAAFNIFWDRFNSFTIAASPITLEYLAGESGLLTLGALTVTAVWLAHRLTSRSAAIATATSGVVDSYHVSVLE